MSQDVELKFKIGTTPRGNYDPAELYDINDVVQDENGVYTSRKTGNTGHPLSDTEWWALTIDLSDVKAAKNAANAAAQTATTGEASRTAAETARVSAESGRASAEATRVSNETARAAAESNRVSNETARAAAESNRVSNENSRTAAETNRNTAETARSTAEQERAAEFASLKAESETATAAATAAAEDAEEKIEELETYDDRVTAIENLDNVIKLFLGYNSSTTTKTLSAGVSGKYVKCATRAAVANAAFAISTPIQIDACSEVFIKTGFNPSDGSHASLDISVISIYEEIERQRVVQKKNAQNQPLYYEVDEDGNPTEVETTTVTDFPVYVTETYTETRYRPNNEDRFVAIPETGYYVANIPDSCKIVISYKPGVTDTSVIVGKFGALANLTSQLLDTYGRQAISEALAQHDARIRALEDGKQLIGNAKAGEVDALEFKKFLYPLILQGHGAPAAAVIPVNLPEGLPWDGIPVFPGQQYINLDATSSGLYYAVGSSSVSDWKQA